jgi:hypothetical protein
VKIGFTVDNTGHAKAERKAADVVLAHPVEAIIDQARKVPPGSVFFSPPIMTSGDR